MSVRFTSSPVVLQQGLWCATTPSGVLVCSSLVSKVKSRRWRSGKYVGRLASTSCYECKHAAAFHLHASVGLEQVQLQALGQ